MSSWSSELLLAFDVTFVKRINISDNKTRIQNLLNSHVEVKHYMSVLFVIVNLETAVKCRVFLLLIVCNLASKLEPAMRQRENGEVGVQYQ